MLTCRRRFCRKGRSLFSIFPIQKNNMAAVIYLQRNYPFGRGILRGLRRERLSMRQTHKCWGVLCPVTAVLIMPYTAARVCCFVRNVIKSCSRGEENTGTGMRSQLELRLSPMLTIFHATGLSIRLDRLYTAG